MTHVESCPYCHRSKAETDFYKDWKPQIYCLGWIDPMTDEPLEVCQNCNDWLGDEQNFNAAVLSH